jgi:CRP-like cAMP-binding protein
MNSQSPNHRNQPEGKSTATRCQTDKLQNIIHLHEVVSENQMKNKTSLLLHSDEPVTVKNTAVILKELFEGIVHNVNQGNFAKAEQLREQLLVEVPTATRTIVRSGEIIEQKKNACMDQKKIQLWADLFNHFTGSEATAFYFALKEFVVKPNQPVFQQGNCDNRLYFITSGSLKLKYFDYDIRKNVVIATLRKGDVAGVETFFMLTNHTTNLMAVEESTISYLDKAAYQKLLSKNHSIESKLLKFCDSRQIKYDPALPATSSRRANKRYKADLNGLVQRFDDNGNLCGEVNPIKIIDLSAGGLAYRVRNLKIGEASHLHNSRINLSAAYEKYSLTYDFNKTAKVVSLKFLPFGECSVHVEFEEPMDESRVMEIAKHTDVMAFI